MADPQSVAASQAAIDRLNSASGGGVVYVLAAEVPSAGIVFSATIEATASSCEGRVLAFFSGRTLGGEIVDGRMVFCSENTASASTAPRTSWGTRSGSPIRGSPATFMFPILDDRRPDFTSREALTMTLLMQRRGGNRFPDNDRDLAAHEHRTHPIGLRLKSRRRP